MLEGVELWKQFKELMCAAGSIVRARRWLWVGMVAGAIIGCVILLPHDLKWSRQITGNRSEQWRRIAFQVSRWGDYPLGNGIVAIVLCAAGLASRQKKWILAGVVCFAAATVAGVETSMIKYSVGRQRPHEDVQVRPYVPACDVWRGFTREKAFNSFPSGHSTTSFATAGALAVALPPVGVPLLVGAGGVVWSRLYLGAHYPADVWTGAWIGLFNGLVLGLASRRCCCGSKPASASKTSPPHPDQ